MSNKEAHDILLRTYEGYLCKYGADDENSEAVYMGIKALERKSYKILAIAEAVLIALGFVMLYARYFGFSVSAVLCALMLFGFLAGGTGWLIILGLIIDKNKGS